MVEDFDTPRLFVEDDDAIDDESIPTDPDVVKPPAAEEGVCWWGICGAIQRADGAELVCVRGVIRLPDLVELVCCRGEIERTGPDSTGVLVCWGDCRGVIERTGPDSTGIVCAGVPDLEELVCCRGVIERTGTDSAGADVNEFV